MVVVDKPAGLVVHPGAGNRTGTLVHGLLGRYPEMAAVGAAGRPGIVHRLDKDTSGLLLVGPHGGRARTALAAQLGRAARSPAGTWRWCGAASTPARAWSTPRSAGRGGRPTRMAVSTSGRSARTRYEVLRTWDDPGVSLVGCTLETGRTHQIRVHLAAIGKPVVGDRRYGGGPPDPARRPPVPPRRHLAFDHPVDGRAARRSRPSSLADLASGRLTGLG